MREFLLQNYIDNIMRKTKIIATLGPATESLTTIKRLIKTGVDVCRLNLSHGDLDWHREMVQLIRTASQQEERPVSIILDLQGPRIRTGLLKQGKPIHLKSGDVVTVTTREIYGREGLIATPYKSLARDVTKGDKILLDDGKMELKVLASTKSEVKCEVITGGLLKEHKGMNLPGVRLNVPSLTDKDKQNLRDGLNWRVDYIAMSFVRSAKDIKIVKDFIKKHGHVVPIIAKIEKPEAVEHIDEILDEADGVMVARGDLGVEMEPQRVPLIQKDIIKRANEKGKTVITATQMLESMISSPRPTRAEASDVANAILDGTDAVMLSGETSVGKYPIEAVRMMSNIASEAEKGLNVSNKFKYEDSSFSTAIAYAALDAAEKTKSRAILAYTISGRTARLLSKLKPRCPIFALTPTDEVYSRLPLLWGVTAVLIPFGESTDEMLSAGERTLVRKRLLNKGDVVVIVSGILARMGATNVMKIHRVGE